MNNSIKNNIKEAITYLMKEDPDRLTFIKMFLSAIVNNEQIKVSMSLNKEAHTVSVLMGEYMYKEVFETPDEANSFIDSLRFYKAKVA